MKIIDKWLKMEKDYNLFNKTLDQNIYVWDIIRMHIYLKYHFPEVEKKIISTNTRQKIKEYLINLNFTFLKLIRYLIYNNKKYLVLTTSRYKEQDKYYDKATRDIIEFFGVNNCLIIEFQEYNKNYLYSSLNNFTFVFKFLFRFKYKINNVVYDIIRNSLISTFNECKINECEINNIINNYLLEYKYYSFIIRIFRIKKIFINQNGLQKGLINAGKKNKIETFEVQHGSFEKDHLAYSYPDTISFNNNIIFPDYLLTFSKYWGSYFNIPAKKIIPLGNNYFVPKYSLQKKEFILVISSIIHASFLTPLTIKLSTKYPTHKIIYKLHSNEFNYINYYRKTFSNYKNINIVYNEINLNNLLLGAYFIIAINSTVIYEALDLNVKTYIYKKGNYLNLFTHPNLKYFSSLNEICITNNENINMNNQLFFSNFNPILLSEIL